MSDKNNKISNVLNSVKSVAGKASEKASDAAEGVKTAVVHIKDDAIAKQTEYKTNLAEKKKTEDYKKLAPIFKEGIENGILRMERVIRIVNYNPRLENEVCKDSVGFFEKGIDRRMPTIYSKYVPLTGYSFYPQMSESVFIADPCIDGKYIEIDEYFNYMKQARVNELTVVAQALGATSVQIALKSNSKSLFNSDAKANINLGSIFNANGEKHKSNKSLKSIEIWANTTFKTSVWSNSPSVPTLLYFRNESDIAALIQMVMVNKSKLTQRTYSMKASSSSGISLSEAASISGLLKGIKCAAGANFASSAEEQSTATLEYTINF